MPDPIADLDLYDAGVNATVTTQVNPDSVTPVEVGAIGTDLSDVLRTYLPLINNQDYLQGTSVPSNLIGTDLALYYQQLVSGFSVWRKQNGIWVLKITMIFTIIEDGILSGLRTFIDGLTVTVSSGTWSIDNARYSKSTQTQFTVPTADANFMRYDLIYADDSGAIGYTTGTASSSPAFPTPATGQILVDYVVVPSVASTASPYLLSGSSGTGSDSAGFVYFTNSNITGIVSNLTTGVISLDNIGSDFPVISRNGIIRGNFDLLIGGTWYANDVPPEMIKDGSGNLISATFTTGNTGITQIRGRIS